MNKLIAAIKRAPKRAASLAIVAAAVVVPAALFAWGPDRPTFTMASPAPYVTFNSITDNAQHGDERNFVQIKEAGASNGTYAENVNLQPGKDYEVFVFYHNNAASNLNDANSNYKGIAKDAFMRVQMPATVKSGEKARITGFVGASNANPAQVWDEAYGTASGDFALRYVPGSATIHSNGAVNGKKLPDTLYTTGTPLGYEALDGKLPGCNQYAGYVTFKFRVDQPNFEVQKQVSKAGENKYSEQVTALPNEEVEYKIQYKNTGTVQQDNVIIKDKLPAGVTYVSGSTQVATSATNGQWTPIADNGVVARGINIGSYAPKGNAYVKFKAKVVDNSKLEKCGINTLINTATAETENGSKSDTANVVVSKECQPPVTPEYKCDALTVTKINRTNFKFATAYTVKNATFKNVTYVIRNESGKEIARTTNPEYTQEKVGKYTVEAIVTVTVDGKDKTATSENCKKPFEVTEVPAQPVYTCDALTATKISRTKFSFNGTATAEGGAQIVSYTFDFGDGKKTTVTNPKNVEHEYAAEGSYDATLSVTVKVNGEEKTVTSEKCATTVTVEKIDECKPGIPTGDERCEEEKCDVPGKEDLPKDSPECVETPTTPETPETPAELPHTGTGENVAAFIGAGSLIAAIGYYVASRRALFGR